MECICVLNFYCKKGIGKIVMDFFEVYVKENLLLKLKFYV